MKTSRKSVSKSTHKALEVLSAKIIKSPVGKLTLVADQNHLLAVLWEEERLGRVRLGKIQMSGKHPILEKAEKQLIEYFSGKRQQFNLPLKLNGTEFQSKVWSALASIPYGETWSYQDLAQKIKSPKASRAVGAANGKNPLSIVIPCHRVIGRDGSLTGFAGGMKNKKYLLDFERSKI